MVIDEISQEVNEEVNSKVSHEVDDRYKHLKVIGNDMVDSENPLSRLQKRCALT